MVAPYTKVDWRAVDKMAECHCTINEIASILGITKVTLYSAAKRDHDMELSEYLEKGRDRGRMNLRKKQYDLAMKGDRTMLVWLGKQTLGQTETMQHNIDFSTIELVINHSVAKDHHEDSD